MESGKDDVASPVRLHVDLQDEIAPSEAQRPASSPAVSVTGVPRVSLELGHMEHDAAAGGTSRSTTTGADKGPASETKNSAAGESGGSVGRVVRRLSKSLSNGLGRASVGGHDEENTLKSISKKVKQKRLRRLRAAKTENLSFLTYFWGMFRLVYAYVFLQSFLFGLAISVSVVLNTSFVIARSLEDPLFAPGQSVLWIFLCPIINILFAWLLDECLDLLMDTLKHSPWDRLNPLTVDDRIKFVYLSTGGERPVMLDLRACLATILAATFVRPRPRSSVENARVIKASGEHVQCESQPSNSAAAAGGQPGEHGPNTASTTQAPHSSSSANGEWWNNKEEDPDPLFILPDWIVIAVELTFIAVFMIFPVAFALSGGGNYNFTTIPAGLITSLMLIALIVAPSYAGMHLIIYLWPRAARINAFLRGDSVAQYAWPPYFTELAGKEVVGPPLEIETKVRLDEFGRPRTESLADKTVSAFKSVVRLHEEDDPVGIALERRRRLRCGVAGSCACWPKCYHIFGCRGHNWSEEDVYYKTLHDWDRMRIDPVIVSSTDGKSVGYGNSGNRHTAVVVRKNEDVHEKSLNSVMQVAHRRFLHSAGKDNQSGNSLLRKREGLPKVNRRMIRQMQLVTRAAAIDETLSPHTTLGATAGPGHLLWYKILRVPLMRLADWLCLGCDALKGQDGKGDGRKWLWDVCCRKRGQISHQRAGAGLDLADPLKREKKSAPEAAVSQNISGSSSNSRGEAKNSEESSPALDSAEQGLNGTSSSNNFYNTMLEELNSWEPNKCFCFSPTCSNNWVLLVIIITYLVLGLLSYAGPELAILIQACLAIVTVLIGYYLWNLAPQIIGRSFYAVVLFQVLFQFQLSIGTTLFHPEDLSGGLKGVYHFANGTARTGPDYAQGSWPAPPRPMLPVCDRHWGNGGAMSVLDAAFLANSVYLDDGGKMAAREVFSGGPLRDARLTILQNQGENRSLIRWSRWDFDQANLTAFVVRGTSNSFDALQDISYYSIASSLKVVLAPVLPIANILPVRFIQELIANMTNPDFAPTEYLELLAELEKTKNGKRKMPARSGDAGGTTMIIGHSLGGAYASIVGSIAKVPTFLLSPPGLYFGVKKFGIRHTSQLYESISSIVPDFDPVPAADYQVGNVQNIPCTAKLAGIGSGIKCHSAQRTLAMLAMACPDTNHPGRVWSIWKEGTSSDDRGSPGKGAPGGAVTFTRDGLPSENGGTGENQVKVPEYWSIVGAKEEGMTRL